MALHSDLVGADIHETNIEEVLLSPVGTLLPTAEGQTVVYGNIIYRAFGPLMSDWQVVGDGSAASAGASGDIQLSDGSGGFTSAASLNSQEIGLTVTNGTAGSFQPLWADLTLDAGAGSSNGADPKYKAAMMGNTLGASLTEDANYIAGIIGAYSVTGTKATTYPAGAVLAQVTDGVTEADGAVVAYIDGDSSLTTANAAFKAMSNNSTVGSGFDYGLDLFGAAHDGYNELAILKADLRLSSEVCFLSGSGVPTDGIAGTGVGFANIGSFYIDRLNGDAYIQTTAYASPTWKLVTRAA